VIFDSLAFSVSEHPKFRKVITLAKAVARRWIATDLLQINYDMYINNNKELLSKDVNVFSLSFYSDVASFKKMPLINILASRAYLQTALLEIVDVTPAHLENGGKKRFFLHLFIIPSPY
jgi:hypothetical protein